MRDAAVGYPFEEEHRRGRAVDQLADTHRRCAEREFVAFTSLWHCMDSDLL